MCSTVLYFCSVFMYILSLFLHMSDGSAVRSRLEQPEFTAANKALMYLSRYGYIDPTIMNAQAQNGASANMIDIRQSIREFQGFAGLNQTGELDEETVIKMNTPRCGVRDKVGYGSNARKKRYALQGSRWKVKHLTYRVTKYPRRLTKAETDSDIAAAFEVWSDVTDLTFSKWVSGKVHIEVRFERGEHGDGDPFDGNGGTLAHAYFPIYGGDAHFDDMEVWTVESYRGTNLLQVAAHEFGHSLGLSHSDVQAALMAPFYRGYQPVVKLDRDDLTGIQSLYGEKSFKKPARPHKPLRPTYPTDPTTNYIPSGTPTSELCKDSSVDAITTLGDGNTYVFKGSQFWRLNDDGIAEGYPKRIRTHFIGLPTKIDAAFTWTNKKTYFFKGSQYYRFTDFDMDPDYPKDMSAGFLGVPRDVDAAFVWSGNGKIYFFKGRSYYKFDPDKRPPVAAKYPKDIALWEGIPYNVDDALMYTNGFTYFFKNGKYWRFNDRSFKVDAADPPFPRAVGEWWFGCPAKSGAQTMKHDATASESIAPSNKTTQWTSDTDGSEDGYVDTSPDLVVNQDESLYHDDNYYNNDDDYDYLSSIPSRNNQKPDAYEKSGATSSLFYPSATFSQSTYFIRNSLTWMVIPVLLRVMSLV